MKLGSALELFDLLSKQPGSKVAADPQSFIRSFFTRHSGLLAPIYYFPGKQPDTVLVYGGIHPSEACSTEIANWLRVKLERQQPSFTAVVIPELFPKESARGRITAAPNKPPGRKDDGSLLPNSSDRNDERTIKNFDQDNYPNRECPVPGMALAHVFRNGSVKTEEYYAPDLAGRAFRFKLPPPKGGWSRILREVLGLTILVEVIKPRRVAAIHGKAIIKSVLDILAEATADLAGTEKDVIDFVRKHKRNAPGIYVDPRYAFDGALQRTCKDFSLDLQKFSPALDPAYPNVDPPPESGQDAVLRHGSHPRDRRRRHRAPARPCDRRGRARHPGDAAQRAGRLVSLLAVPRDR